MKEVFEWKIYLSVWWFDANINQILNHTPDRLHFSLLCLRFDNGTTDRRNPPFALQHRTAYETISIFVSYTHGCAKISRLFQCGWWHTSPWIICYMIVWLEPGVRDFLLHWFDLARISVHITSCLVGKRHISVCISGVYPTSILSSFVLSRWFAAE